MSKSVVRSVKNVTKGYSSTQVKVRNATSNDAWGPSGTEMSDIARMTFNNSNDFYEIMDMLDKRLNDKGKNWRHVLKSLKVLDYCLHEGSELVVTWARKNIYIIKTLREFQYIDDDGRDVGQNVRHSAKELSSLIMDEARLRAERKDRKSWKTRVTGLDDYNSSAPGFGENPDAQRSRRAERRPKRADEDDLEYKLALEASKNEAEEDRKRRERAAASGADDDDDLAKAIRLSKEEEDLRRRELEESNASSLFDDMPLVQPAQTQPTGWNQGYQQQGAVDWLGNPVDAQQQQAQTTGFLNNAYAQPMQNQQTGFQNGFGYNPYAQPQQTGFDQSQFQQPQQQQQQQQQQGYLEPQQTAFNLSNPYSQQNNGFGAQSPQQSAPLPTGSHNPWASTGTTNKDPFDNLKPQPTGSNNPFASASSNQATRPPNPMSLSSLAEQKATTSFSTIAAAYPSSSQPSSPLQQQHTQTQSQNPHHAHLNALLATGEGQDTFGNVGNQRIPAQHTAPGAFVNSAGQGLRLQPSQTGNNPFFQHQQGQFTGAGAGAGAQQGQFGQGLGQYGQQGQQQMYPAQTGPVGGGGAGGGFGSTNPFGPGRGAQQGGSLIDL